MGGREDVEFFIYDVIYWDVFVGWELLGDEGDFTNVFIVAAVVFGDIRQNLLPSF